MTAQTIEYSISEKPWRVNQPGQFLQFFRLKNGEVGKFHFWAAGRPDLLAPWTIARMFFGIEPMIQSENADVDLYGSSLSVDEIADLRKCDAEEIKIELQALAMAWKVFQRTQPVEAPVRSLVPANDFTPPSDQKFDVPDAPLSPIQSDVLKYRGFFPSDFEVDGNKAWTEGLANREMQALYARLIELKKVFDEPMAKEVGRQALINEVLLRRVDQELLRMAPSSPKFAILRQTKQEIETTLLKQWAEVEKICPFVKGAINKMTAIGAFSDLGKGDMEWSRDKTHIVFDGLYTAYEMQAELRESEQLPSGYRPGWVAAMLEARAGLFDPNFRRTMKNSHCKILDMAFQAAAKAYNERWGIKLPDLLKEGPDGEYPPIVLADPASEEDEPVELRDRENIDDQLAAEAQPAIDLDTVVEPATNGANSFSHNGR